MNYGCQIIFFLVCVCVSIFLGFITYSYFFKVEMLYRVLFLYLMLRRGLWIFKIIYTENQTGIKNIS